MHCRLPIVFPYYSVSEHSRDVGDQLHVIVLTKLQEKMEWKAACTYMYHVRSP